MEIELNVSLNSVMTMMDCPRCGFNQPEDRFCAQCGLDIYQYQERPKPIFKRLIQNPNLHLSLILCAIFGVTGYILYSRSELVKKESYGFKDVPLNSRQAAVPEAQRTQSTAAPDSKRQQLAAQKSAAEIVTAASQNPNTSNSPSGNLDSSQSAASRAAPTHLEASFWEVPRETLVAIIQAAEKVGDSGSGRAYLFTSGKAVYDSIVKASASVTIPRPMDLEESMQMSIENPAGIANRLQFGFFVFVEDRDEHSAHLRWDAQVSLPLDFDPASGAVSSTSAANISGSSTLTGENLLVIVLEPPVRNAKTEAIVRPGDGPWSIVNSPEFRSGVTEWVGLVRLTQTKAPRSRRN